MMADTTRKPVKMQVFPQQKMTGLPKDQDVELTVVPKQVIQFQGISAEEGASKLTVTVDASGKSKLHYTPKDCRAGESACFEGPGMHELWVPRISGKSGTISLVGNSSRMEFKLPKSIFDSNSSLQFMLGEFRSKPAAASSVLVSQSQVAPPEADSIEDFFVAIPDSGDILKNSGIPKGGQEVSSLSESQRESLGDFIKEAAGAAGMVLDNKDLLRDFGISGKFYLSTQDGKTYVVFKGYAGLRKIFKGTRYSLDKNLARFSILTIKKGGMDAALQGLPSKTKGTAIGFLFLGAVETWRWLAQDEEGRFLSDLLIDLGSSAIKGVLSGVIAASLFGFGLTFFATTPVALVVVGVIVVGIVVGYGLDILDEKLEITERAKDVGRKAETQFKSLWQEYVEEPLSDFVKRCEWEIRRGMAYP